MWWLQPELCGPGQEILASSVLSAVGLDVVAKVTCCQDHSHIERRRRATHDDRRKPQSRITRLAS